MDESRANGGGLPETRRLGLVALLVCFAAKGGALVPAYALDDYQSVHVDRDLAFYFSQGRFTQALIQTFLTFVDVKATSIEWPIITLGIVAYAGLAALGVQVVTRGRGDFVTKAIAASIICAHPYVTEYFTFREAMVTQAVAFLLTASVLGSIVRTDATDAAKGPTRRTWAFFVFGSALVAAAQQNLFVVLALFVLFRVLSETITESGPIAPRVALRRDAPWLSGLAAAGSFYALVFVVVRNVGGFTRDGRASLLHAHEVPERAAAVGRQIAKILVKAEPVLSRGSKRLLLAMLVALVVTVAVRSVRRGFGLLFAFALGLLASVALVAISSEWWPVPRATFAVGVAVGGVVAIAAAWTNRRNVFVVTLAAPALVALIFQSSQILFEQGRLNRWDAWAAGAIANDLARMGLPPEARFAVVGAPFVPVVGLETSQGDLNVSALSIGWAVAGAMREATGRTFDVDEGRTHDVACADGPLWPVEGGIRSVDGVVIVCVGRP